MRILARPRRRTVYRDAVRRFKALGTEASRPQRPASSDSDAPPTRPRLALSTAR